MGLSFDNINFSVGQSAVFICAFFAIGTLLWLFIRKRKNLVWMPILRVIRVESKKLPELKFKMPPLIPFMCFVACAATLSFIAFRPYTIVFTPFGSNQIRYHLIVDMSPSVSSHISLDGLKDRIRDIYSSIKEDGKISFSSSINSNIIRFESDDEINKWIDSLEFHRSGWKIASSVSLMLKSLEDVDHLVIASDRDLHTWDGFNWQFLSDDIQISLVDLTNTSKMISNHYFYKTEYIDRGASTKPTWDVTLVRNSDAGVEGGRLTVTQAEKSLAELSYTFPEGSTHLRLEVPLENLENDTDPLTWEISPGKADRLPMDNTYRSMPLGIARKIILLKPPEGERFLLEGSYPLQKALMALGFVPDRRDHAVAENLASYPLYIIYGGQGLGLDLFCPDQIRRDRLDGKSHMPIVWLMPHRIDADYKELCLCYHRLAIAEDDRQASYCEDVQTRDQWVGVMQSTGSKQLGGKLGHVLEAVAWHYKVEGSSFELLSFTVPLEPGAGLDFGQLPIWIKTMTSWLGLTNHNGNLQKHSWPRVPDLASDKQQLGQVQSDLSNVPEGESRLSIGEDSNFPSQWHYNKDGKRRRLPSRNDQDDPMPWIRLCSLLVIGILGIETVWFFLRSMISSVLRKPELLILPILWNFNNYSQAETKISALSLPYLNPSVERLSNEVGSRTSITLDGKVEQFGKIGTGALNNPWLWAYEIEALKTGGAGLRMEVVTWLKRGGFLVIENYTDLEQLNGLTANKFVLGDREGWMAIPPDHELMRSFHLLSALPTCDKRVWYGFHFDGRLAILASPFSLIEAKLDKFSEKSCLQSKDYELATRTFINIVMVAMTTDYKKDQIHLKEILKRLRQ